MKVTKKISSIVDGNVVKTTINIEKPSAEYYISQIQVGNDKPRFVDEDSIDILYQDDKDSQKEVTIIQNLDKDTIRELFGVSLEDDISVKEKIDLYNSSQKESDSLTHQVFSINDIPIRKNIIDFVEENITHISRAFINPSDNRASTIFFIDLENLIRHFSLFKKISTNIIYDNDFYQSLKILDCKIYRQRVSDNLYNNEYFEFVDNQVDTLIDTELETLLFFNDETKIVGYRFFDEIKSLSFGKYRYIVDITFNDPVQQYISNILSDLSTMMSKYNTNLSVSNVRIVEEEIKKDIEKFKKYEKLMYSKESQTSVNNYNNFLMFGKKVEDLYYNLYEYYNSVSYDKCVIKIYKKFKEIFDVDEFLSFNENINSIKKTGDIEDWKENKKIINIPNNVESISYKYAYEYNVEIDNNNESVLEVIDQKILDSSRYQILFKFDDGVRGDQWISLDNKNTVFNTSTKYLCKIVNNNNIPINNQYFIIENK